MNTHLSEKVARQQRTRLGRRHAPLVILAGALLSCGQPHSAQQQPSALPPAVAYEAHLVAGDTPPPSGSLRNPHDGDSAVTRSGSLLLPP